MPPPLAGRRATCFSHRPFVPSVRAWTACRLDALALPELCGRSSWSPPGDDHVHAPVMPRLLAHVRAVPMVGLLLLAASRPVFVTGFSNPNLRGEPCCCSFVLSFALRSATAVGKACSLLVRCFLMTRAAVKNAFQVRARLRPRYHGEATPRWRRTAAPVLRAASHDYVS